MESAVRDMEKVGQRLGTFRKISYFCPQKHRGHGSMCTYYIDVQTEDSTRLNLVNLTMKSRIHLFEATTVPRKGMDCFDYIPTSGQYQSLTEWIWKKIGCVLLLCLNLESNTCLTKIFVSHERNNMSSL